MIKRKYMRTRQLKPGMIIDQSVEDRMGRNLVVRGSTLDDYIIESLLKLGVMSVYIQDGEYAPDDPDKILSPSAKHNVERFREDDRSKVTLSDSVRKRVAEGIQYIYNNTEPEQMAEASDSIANDLLEAIESNSAIAIDINELKTSDEYTFKHSVDVATIAMIVAKQQGLSRKKCTKSVLPVFCTMWEKPKFLLKF